MRKLSILLSKKTWRKDTSEDQYKMLHKHLVSSLYQRKTDECDHVKTIAISTNGL